MEALVPKDRGFAARCLLRAARVGTLATKDAGGAPFASLVTPAIAPDGSVLMLLSGLAAHTRHLRANSACALMVTGAQDGPNPQTAPRVTVTGRAVPDADPALRQFWLTHHPYAAMYADFTDFALWRLEAVAAHVVGGFAQASKLTGTELLPPSKAVEALKEAADRIIGHCNDDHADSLNLLALRRGHAGAWRMVAVDCDGFDLASGETVLRLAFDAPVEDGPGVRTELVRLVRMAQEK